MRYRYLYIKPIVFYLYFRHKWGEREESKSFIESDWKSGETARKPERAMGFRLWSVGQQSID